jgi:hypothetical protein
LLFCVLGKHVPANAGPPKPPQFPKYLHCYRCVLETKELGCLLGSDICLTPAGSSCITLHIKNSKLLPSSTCLLLSQTASFSLLSCTPHLVPTALSHCSIVCIQNNSLSPLPPHFPPQPTAHWLLLPFGTHP